MSMVCYSFSLMDAHIKAKAGRDGTPRTAKSDVLRTIVLWCLVHARLAPHCTWDGGSRDSG